MQDVVSTQKKASYNGKQKQESFDAINIRRIEKKRGVQSNLANNTRKKEKLVAVLVIAGLMGLTIASVMNNGLHLKEIVISSLIIGGIAIIRTLGESDFNRA